jgi:hypothetical protein
LARSNPVSCDGNRILPPGQQDAGAAAAWFPALTTIAGLQANWDFLSDFRNAPHWPWMRSVPRRLSVLGVSPVMAAFWTSHACAPVGS